MLSNVPLQLRTRRRRQTTSPSPSSSASPSDSGYGSASPPLAPQAKENGRPLAELWTHGDGNQSDSDDPFVDSDRGTAFRETASAPYRALRSSQKKPVALPKRTPYSRPNLPISFYPGSGARLQQRGRTLGSLRSPDRFIPARPQEAHPTERFRTGKEPHELTATEKLLRHSGGTEDAFCYRRRLVTPLASELRPQSRSESVSRIRVGTVLGPLDQNSIDGNDSLVSQRTVWTVGLGGTAVDNGHGQLIRSGTNAPLFRATFPTVKPKTVEEQEKHGARLAAALGLDRAQRVFEVNLASHREGRGHFSKRGGNPSTQWNGTEWVNEAPLPKPRRPLDNRALPTAPFKVLDAPNLRDDFYCSILAYSPTSQTLAVALGDLLYGWSESRGVQLLSAGTDADCHLTSVAFSSAEGCKSILAFGRSNRTLGLMSLYDDPDPAPSHAAPMPRFEVIQPAPVACLSWRPACTVRPSRSQTHPDIPVKTEDLLVGDETGHIYYYAVEWPERWEVERHNWAGEMTLLARISVHSQQICGLSWSPNGEIFGSGGNDNLCCIFETTKVFEPEPEGQSSTGERQTRRPTLARVDAASEASEAESRTEASQNPPPPVRHLGPGDEKHRWVHGAAVKAIAFCPWQETLVATGGGSNDKCIHFFHTRSGAALASISVSAQVTSLIWSTTRREIAATFGYAQPEHPVRIAVFSWPECRQVAIIPWAGEHRALYAIPYPIGPEGSRSSGSGNPNSNVVRSRSRAEMEGCIIVASSDRSVKFHEVWAADRKATSGGIGILGGSDILEYLEGIDKEGPVIR